jgi:hypothetical protein
MSCFNGWEEENQIDFKKTKKVIKYYNSWSFILRDLITIMTIQAITAHNCYDFKQKLLCNIPHKRGLWAFLWETLQWGETVSELGLLRVYCSYPTWYMSMESHDGMILAEKYRRTRRKISLSTILSTTHPTRTDLAANTELRIHRPATNRLGHGMAYR